mmetsp:Transcript_6773/g.16870  ORF Transcript_6773/g.16870 Transcript_6773/m.16870 type:complete len:309 (+) Transcript_6773:289-1215(+)
MHIHEQPMWLLHTPSCSLHARPAALHLGTPHAAGHRAPTGYRLCRDGPHSSCAKMRVAPGRDTEEAAPAAYASSRPGLGRHLSASADTASGSTTRCTSAPIHGTGGPLRGRGCPIWIWYTPCVPPPGAAAAAGPVSPAAGGTDTRPGSRVVSALTSDGSSAGRATPCASPCAHHPACTMPHTRVRARSRTAPSTRELRAGPGSALNQGELHSAPTTCRASALKGAGNLWWLCGLHASGTPASMWPSAVAAPAWPAIRAASWGVTDTVLFHLVAPSTPSADTVATGSTSTASPDWYSQSARSSLFCMPQ